MNTIPERTTVAISGQSIMTKSTSPSFGPPSAPAEIQISNVSNGCETRRMPTISTPALSMARFTDQQNQIETLKMQNDKLWMKLKRLEICHLEKRKNQSNEEAHGSSNPHDPQNSGYHQYHQPNHIIFNQHKTIPGTKLQAASGHQFQPFPQFQEQKFQEQKFQNQLLHDEKEERKFLAKIEVLRENIMEEQKTIDRYVEKAMSLKYPTEGTDKRFQELSITPRDLKRQKVTLRLEKTTHSNSARVDQSWKNLEVDGRKLEDSLKFLESMCSMEFGMECSKNTLKLLDLAPLNLESWSGPTVYEASTSWMNFYKSNGVFSTSARKYFLEKCINSIEDKAVVTDIRQTVAPETIEELIDYLLKNFGQPAKMQAILIQKHFSLDKMVWPITSKTVQRTYNAIKTHIGLMNSAEAIINYITKENGENGADIRLQEGILTKEYFQTLVRVMPVIKQSEFMMRLSLLNAREKFQAIKLQLISMREEAHNFATNWSEIPIEESEEEPYDMGAWTEMQIPDTLEEDTEEPYDLYD